MTDQTHTISITLMGQQYQVKCAADHIDDLQNCVALLNEKMEEVAKKMPQTSKERLMIMAALHVTHELLHLQKQQMQNEHEHVQTLLQKINETLSDNNEKNTIIRISRRAYDS